jgi:hypothetical protein
MENHAKYGDSIYFYDGEGVYVNLFIASELNWGEKGIRIKQETNFPEQDRTSLIVHVNKPMEMTLRIRIPYWIAEGGYAEINGLKLETFSSPGSYLELRRTWRDGDRLDVWFPMRLHCHPMPDDPDLVAIMYGPLVLAGELDVVDLPREEIYGKYGPAGEPILVPYFSVKTDDIESWIAAVEDEPLRFCTVDAGIPYDVILIPFYKLFGHRYAIYWEINKDKE